MEAARPVHAMRYLISLWTRYVQRVPSDQVHGRTPGLLGKDAGRHSFVLLLLAVAAAVGTFTWISSSQSGKNPNLPDADDEISDGKMTKLMIRAIAVSADGDDLELVQGGAVWQHRDAHTGRELERNRLSHHWLSYLQFRGNDGTWVAANAQSELELIYDGRPLWRERLPDQQENEVIHGCSVGPGRDLIAAVSNQGSLWFLEFDREQAVPRGRFSLGEPLEFARLSPAGDRVLIGTWSRKLLIWDVAQAQVALRLGAGDRGARFGSWSGDGRWLISFGDTQELDIWNAETGQVARQLKIDWNYVLAAELSDDGALAAVGDGDTIRIWNLETGVESPPLIGHDVLISALQFADEGRALFSGDIQGNLRRWSVSQHREVWAVHQ